MRGGESSPVAPLRIALYGEVDMNLIDGSSVWVQSVSQMLVTLPEVTVTVLLRTPEHRDLLTAPLREHERIEVVEPPPGGESPRLSPAQALAALDALDREQPFDLVLLRGQPVSEAAARRGAFPGRLWIYYLPKHDPPLGAETDHVRLIAPACERLLCQTEPIRALAESAAPEQAAKMILLPPMIPSVLNGAGQEDPPEHLKLVYAGKVAPEYYFIEMLETFRRLRRWDPEAELHLIGDKIHNPPGDRGFKPAAEAALERTENLVWHGGVSREDTLALLDRFDVALSIRDPRMDRELATKVLEYGAASCSVLLNRTPLYEELLGEDYPLFVLEPGEAVAALRRVRDQPAVREEAAARVRAAAEQHTFERVAERLAPYLREAEGYRSRRVDSHVSSEPRASAAWTPELAERLAGEALGAVGLGGCTIRPLHFRKFATFRVEDPQLFLKVGDPGNEQAFATLDRSLTVGMALHAKGFPVVAPAGEFAERPLRLGGGCAAFWRWQEHQPGARPDPMLTGTLLRSFHELLSELPVAAPPYDPITLPRRRLDVIESRGGLDGSALGFLRGRLDRVAEGWESFHSELGVGPIHADLRLRNILVTDRGPVFIDLDNLHTGPREWDLALVSPTPGFEWRWEAEEWPAFASGYGHDFLSREDNMVLRELGHLRSLTSLLYSRKEPYKVRRAERLVEQWMAEPHRSCFQLDWEGAFESAPRWNPEHAAALARQALDSVGLGGARPTPLQFGRFASYRVEGPSRFLKLADPGFRSAHEVLERSLRLGSWLHDEGLPVVRPAEEGAGAPIAAESAWAGLWHWQQHDRDARPDPRAAGELLRALHDRLDGCTLPVPTVDQLDAARRHLSALADGGHLDQDSISFLLERLESAAEGWGRFSSELGSGPLHGDFKVPNLLVGPGGLVLVDLENAHRGPREWDLSRVSPGRPYGWRVEEWDDFADGYGHDLLSAPGGEAVREVDHLRSLIWLLSDPGHAVRLQAGERLLAEWRADPGRGCRQLSWDRLGSVA